MTDDEAGEMAILTSRMLAFEHALKMIADTEDEDDEWDARDKFHLVRAAARSTIMAYGRSTPPKAGE